MVATVRSGLMPSDTQNEVRHALHLFLQGITLGTAGNITNRLCRLKTSMRRGGLFQ
jgi:hypothetical protein